jgi:hypothetical protein
MQGRWQAREGQKSGLVSASGKGSAQQVGTDLEAILACVSTSCDVHVDTLERNERATSKCPCAQTVGCQGLQVDSCRGTCLEIVIVILPNLSGTTEPCRASSPQSSNTSCNTGPPFERALVFHSANRAKSSVPLAAFVTTYNASDAVL